MPQQLDKEIDAKNFSEASLSAWLQEHNVAPYRAGQIMRWIYHQRLMTFAEMTNLSRDLRTQLSDSMIISHLRPALIQTSCDETKKFLFRLEDGQSVESVLIPQKNHWTVCISSQVGCAMGCKFCFTGRNGFIRNLQPSEIVNQVCAIQDEMADPAQLTNIVLMGMGEPLANYQNVVRATEILTSMNGLQFANRRITISTAGLVPQIAALGRDTKVSLAVSLNAVDNEVRSELMPINKTYPIEVLLEACKEFPLPVKKMITFEYILIDNVNDQPQDAYKLAKLLGPIRAKINLIPFNPFEGCQLGRPSEQTVLAFQEILMSRNFTAIVRHSKGTDIMAACGQLRAADIESEAI